MVAHRGRVELSLSLDWIRPNAMRPWGLSGELALSVFTARVDQDLTHADCSKTFYGHVWLVSELDDKN